MTIAKKFVCDICKCDDKSDYMVVDYRDHDGTIELATTDAGQFGDMVFCRSCLQELGAAISSLFQAHEIQ